MRRPASTRRRRSRSVDGRPDGVHVPATLMRQRDTPLDGTAPAVLYAYGYTFEPEQDPALPALPALLDRGVVWVHVRGGSEEGPRRRASSTPTGSPPAA